MAGKGGYQRPNKPAAVSGPGKYSKRTDGKPGETPKQAARYISGGAYGEGKEMMDIQQSAPMSAAPGVPSSPTGMPMDLPEPIPFDAPTQRPDEPVTAGNPLGAGIGPSVPDTVSMDPVDRERLAVLLGYLQRAAEKPNATQATREYVRYLRGVL